MKAARTSILQFFVIVSRISRSRCVVKWRKSKSMWSTQIRQNILCMIFGYYSSQTPILLFISRVRKSRHLAFGLDFLFASREKDSTPFLMYFRFNWRHFTYFSTKSQRVFYRGTLVSWMIGSIDFGEEKQKEFCEKRKSDWRYQTIELIFIELVASSIK